MHRRDALRWLSAAATLPLSGAACARGRKEGSSTMNATPSRLPAIFVAHGAPMLLEDALWMSELAAWSKALPKPKAILVVSAHWDRSPVSIGATKAVPLIYDFYGFPAHFYSLQYASPGAPELAARVREQLRAASIDFRDDPERGLDHGTYVPLMAMFPKADVPVLQISMPGEDPRALVSLGRALAPLRDEGVLLVGSGFLTHNMRAFSRTTPSWASEFDGWARDVLAARDVDALSDYRKRAPAVDVALPTREHFVPVLFAAGAGGSDPVTFPITGFAFGSFTKRSAQWG